MPVAGPLLCGVDFSQPSRRALRVALVLARQLGEPLTVVTVLHPLLAHAAEVSFTPGQFLRDTARDLEHFIATALPGNEPFMPATTPLVTVGDPAQSLLDTAASQHSSIVIVGTRGLGKAQRLWFGSTTAKLFRLATLPVLAVPDRDQDPVQLSAKAPRLNTERLVCGIDFEEASIAAARVAFDLGRRLAIPVELLHAVGELAGPEEWASLLESTARESLADARPRLEALLAQLGERATASVKPGPPADVLIAEVASDPPALLVMGLGAPGSKPGSTATEVLAGSHAPVLAVPPA